MFGQGFDSPQLHPGDNAEFLKICVVPFSLKPLSVANNSRTASLIIGVRLLFSSKMSFLGISNSKGASWMTNLLIHNNS